MFLQAVARGVPSQQSLPLSHRFTTPPSLGARNLRFSKSLTSVITGFRVWSNQSETLLKNETLSLVKVWVGGAARGAGATDGGPRVRLHHQARVPSQPSSLSPPSPSQDVKPDFIFGDLAFVGTFLLAKKIDVPFGLLSCAPLAEPVASLFSNVPTAVLSVPAFGSGLTTPMRTYQVVLNVAVSLMNALVFLFIDATLHRPLFASHQLHRPHLGSDALVIVNADPLMEWPRRPLPPWVKLVGPLTPRPVPRSSVTSNPPLVALVARPFIYASMGTLSALSRTEMLALRATFNKLSPSVRVVWKVSESDLPPDLDLPELASGLAASVTIIESAPQNALLASPNCVGFLTHGGNNGLYEAAFHGVPAAVLAMIADQDDNASKYVSGGMAVRVRNVSHDAILTALQELLHKPSYRQRAEEVARILKNRPSPLLQALDWIEFAISTGGVPYAKPKAP